MTSPTNLSSATTTPTPRPIPQFFNDYNNLTTKRERYSSTPKCKQLPPRPPSKSFQQYSRLSFTLNHSSCHPQHNSNQSNQQQQQQKARIISFKNEQQQSKLSPLYNDHRKESYLKQCYQVEELIGSGSFGDVFRCRNRWNQRYYAVKVSREKFKGRIDREEKLNEVCKHEQLPDHDHLVKLHYAWEEKQRLYIEQELCAGTLSMLADNNHDLNESIIWAILVDLLKALDHLHSNNLIHLDIKPENIFISMDGICKLGDFGLIFDMNNELKEAMEGDPKYLAGEIMQGIFTKSADIFSLGMTILEITSDLDLPSRGDAWHWLRNGNIPDYLFKHRSDDLKQIIKMMLNPDHLKRPTARQLLQHPFIIEYENHRRHELMRKKLQTKFTETINMIDKLFLEQKLLLPLWSCIKQMINILAVPFRFLLTNIQQQTNSEMILASLLNQPNSSSSSSTTSSSNSNNQGKTTTTTKSPNNYNRTYVSNYLDQYSDDDMMTMTMDNNLTQSTRFLSTNLSFDLSFGSNSGDDGDSNYVGDDKNHRLDDSFEHRFDKLSNRNLCSTVNRLNNRQQQSPSNFEMTPKLSPLSSSSMMMMIPTTPTSPINGYGIGGYNKSSLLSTANNKSVIQRLTFDEFSSSDEMEMSENDDNDDNDNVINEDNNNNNHNNNSIKEIDLSSQQPQQQQQQSSSQSSSSSLFTDISTDVIGSCCL
uniref:non-specific serine/threonine protein kinase n=1 Tax=Dermatophagoides pteronyssinus TaxID=6956 RepID=A0A6P6Y8D3_DERPT|nr:membrane-associated tyrosine- and threonine-specific cdc2-inhibitory kinase-like [Dermatophagoides pteronyssinus]